MLAYRNLLSQSGDEQIPGTKPEHYWGIGTLETVNMFIVEDHHQLGIGEAKPYLKMDAIPSWKRGKNALAIFYSCF